MRLEASHQLSCTAYGGVGEPYRPAVQDERAEHAISWAGHHHDRDSAYSSRGRRTKRPLHIGLREAALVSGQAHLVHCRSSTQFQDLPQVPVTPLGEQGPRHEPDSEELSAPFHCLLSRWKRLVADAGASPQRVSRSRTTC